MPLPLSTCYFLPPENALPSHSLLRAPCLPPAPAAFSYSLSASELQEGYLGQEQAHPLFSGPHSVASTAFSPAMETNPI